MKLSGVYLPIITPYIDNTIDFKSYENLIEHYIPKGIAGLIPLGTTGENQTIQSDEYEEILDRTMQIVNKRVPVFIGAGGSDTRKTISLSKLAASYAVEGILSVCPYYNCPGQEGLYHHFSKISESTPLSIIIYNIPHRTGVNLQNDTLFKLSEKKNIIGVKDCSGNMKQTLQLLRDKPDDFSVLTGDDLFFFSALANGADGGILASAHIQTEIFIKIHQAIEENDHQKARACFKPLMPMISLLFEEANPSPLKYLLNRLELIQSFETRSPIIPVSDALKIKLDRLAESITQL